MNIPIYQVDAFADQLFAGNPAAVCPLEGWIDATLMQHIAAENNLAETVFFVPRGTSFEIRWFTPAIEVDLCGHATLAAAFVLFNELGVTTDSIHFISQRSGDLYVSKEGEILLLDFPSDLVSQSAITTEAIKDCIGVAPMEVLRGKSDIMAVVESEKVLQQMTPDFAAIAKLDARGLIVTAKGDNVDFVSRFFAPQSGVNEDPVTGSAHTTLLPYWSAKLGKTELAASQLSARGGQLQCAYLGDRCRIGGKAALYLKGNILL